jgi:ABC-type Zn uptake system ZnuABC Zn-binding protein ZnuA
MKKNFLVLLIILILTGCKWTEDFSDRYLYTTMYPIEYAASALYGEHAKVASVYPNGVDQTYSVSEKKKKQYSKAETFIYSGVANEATLARDLLNLNRDLQIIDATKGMNSNNKLASIWIDPSNYLMLCSNIKVSLIEYADNPYLKEEIENKYKELNVLISELDVQLYNIGRNGNYDTILTTNNVFEFLKKYNINVISIDSKNETLDKSYAEAKKMIQDKKIQYVYFLQGDEFTESQSKFISDNSLVKIEIPNIYTLTDENRKENKDYISIMNDIISEYKKELYKK